MKTILHLLAVCILFSSLFYLSACTPSSTNTPSTRPSDVEFARLGAAQKFDLKAKFVKFEYKERAHYYFEDEDGKIWDFRSCEASNITFERALPEDKASVDNQGWGSNQRLEGKWFQLKCSVESHPVTGQVATILESQLLE